MFFQAAVGLRVTGPGLKSVSHTWDPKIRPMAYPFWAMQSLRGFKGQALIVTLQADQLCKRVEKSEKLAGEVEANK